MGPSRDARHASNKHATAATVIIVPATAAAVGTSIGRRSGTEAAALTLLYGLVASGQIVLRRIDGHEQLPTSLAQER